MNPNPLARQPHHLEATGKWVATGPNANWIKVLASKLAEGVDELFAEE